MVVSALAARAICLRYKYGHACVGAPAHDVCQKRPLPMFYEILQILFINLLAMHSTHPQLLPKEAVIKIKSLFRKFSMVRKQ